MGCTRPYSGPATGLEKAPGDRDRDINDLLDRETYKSEAKSWSNAPPCTADRQISGWLAGWLAGWLLGHFRQQRWLLQKRRKFPFVGGTDVRLAHQLPGRPAEEHTHPLHPLRLTIVTDGRCFSLITQHGGAVLV